MNSKNRKLGFTVIEILISVAVIGMAFSAILGVMSLSLKLSRLNKESFKANSLMKETLEEVRNFRDNTEWGTDGLGSLSTGTEYHPELNASNEWIMASGSETIGDLTRKVTLESVLRDANDDIVQSGGSVDPDTYKINVTVEWGDGKSIDTSTYLTNWRD